MGKLRLYSDTHVMPFFLFTFSNVSYLT